MRVQRMAVAAVNADTTYGVDTSAANNYGLGCEYTSTAMMAKTEAAQSVRPSLWWLAAAVALILWFV